MRNRDVLVNTCLYDLLLGMQKRLEEDPYGCIIRLAAEHKGLKEPEYCDYIHHNCEECIENWLNKER